MGEHKIALLYESTGRVKKSEGWTTQRVQPDMEYMCSSIFTHPNYYRVDGKPVIVMYLSRALSANDVFVGEQ